jgi:hypothetical protein
MNDLWLVNWVQMVCTTVRGFACCIEQRWFSSPFPHGRARANFTARRFGRRVTHAARGTQGGRDDCDHVYVTSRARNNNYCTNVAGGDESGAGRLQPAPRSDDRPE